MKFFNIDCHISVISDIKNILEQLGHTVEHWSISGHRWVFGFNPCPSSIINSSNWKQLDEKMVNDFYEAHKKDIDKYDGFICTYPIAFLKLFEKFNKPILAVCPIRYEHPFTNNPEKLSWLEDSLKNNKNIIRVANNQFDQKYCEKFLGNKWEWIPSLCDYTHCNYNKSIDKFVVFSKFPINLNSSNFIHQSSLGRYKWKDLYSFKGIIHFPYNVSTMSIFEQYQAGVPLYFPSLNYSIDLLNNNIPLFSEITFNNQLEHKSADKFLNKNWLQYSDFYNGTINCQKFENVKDIKEVNPKPKSNKDLITEKWKQIIKSIE